MFPALSFSPLSTSETHTSAILSDQPDLVLWAVAVLAKHGRPAITDTKVSQPRRGSRGAVGIPSLRRIKAKLKRQPILQNRKSHIRIFN